MIDLDAAIAKLTANGLYVRPRRTAGREVEIIGGAEYRNAGGIDIFKNGFNITLEGNEWVARYAGDGQMINEIYVTHLDEAVEVILNFYRAQGVVR